MKSGIRQKEPIALRAKELMGGRKSLYLDYYVEGSKNHNHKYEFLKLYLLPETSKENKELNKVTLQSAKAIQAQRLIERANGKAGIKNKADCKIFIIDYLRHFADLKAQYGQSKHRESTIKNAIKHIERYNPNVTLNQIDKDYCLGFIRYLSTAKSFKGNEPKSLGKSTANLYYFILVAALNQAVREELIEVNPASKVNAEEKRQIAPTKSTRTYLSIDELQRMVDTPTRSERVRNAFLFACYTGLRISDILSLKWEDIRKENGKMFIQKTMIKTKQNVIVPIGKSAASYLPKKKKRGVYVFDLPEENSINSALKTWVKKAEIKKNISFHCSRHTFATMLLTKGADLYTVSKLLGHTDIAITQVYAEIVNQKKVDAIDLLD